MMVFEGTQREAVRVHDAGVTIYTSELLLNMIFQKIVNAVEVKKQWRKWREVISVMVVAVKLMRVLGITMVTLHALVSRSLKLLPNLSRMMLETDSITIVRGLYTHLRRVWQ